ncbi:MAG: hypothetical protein Q4P18_06900 [Methanobrevibacter sp.]|uniref:hypothetical protein n=1 Tax=Methanobrevibacter sp. TaxID=66852 RepID=UPI0026DED0C0|nr:hypothetical protein [Methanobrevibacter sp.]MDO5849244.1 hypothetical protein [Methanobrevibacter sp.]
MNQILKEILEESEYFEKNNENIYIPKYLGLIVNSIVVYDVNWVIITEEELMLMNEHVQNHPIASVHLKNINSILIITEDGIKEVL